MKLITTTATTVVAALAILITAQHPPVQATAIATAIDVGSPSSLVGLSTATDPNLIGSSGPSITSSVAIIESTQTPASSLNHHLQTTLGEFSNDGPSEMNVSSTQANITSMPTSMKSWVSEDTSMENVVSDTVVGQMSEGGNDTATTSRAGAGSPVRRTRGLAKGWVVSFAVVGLVILLWMNLKYFLSERKTPRPETPRKGQVWSERLSRVASEWVWH